MEILDQLSRLVQILFVDLIPAGDNVIVIGMVAAILPGIPQESHPLQCRRCSDPESHLRPAHCSAIGDNWPFYSWRCSAFMDMLETLARIARV